MQTAMASASAPSRRQRCSAVEAGTIHARPIGLLCSERLLRGDRMRGVKYLYNAYGKRTAVLIDLGRNRALWDDIFDVALARTRANEGTARWTTVRRRLERRGRLKPAKASR